MLANAWQKSFLKETKTFKQLSSIGFIESNPTQSFFVQIDESFIDKKDEYSGSRREPQILASFLNSEFFGYQSGDVLIVDNIRYQLQVISDKDEIIITYIVLAL